MTDKAQTEIPDFLGKDTRVVTVADMLEQAQRQQLQHTQMRLINHDDMDDPIPQPNGQPGKETYAERLAELDAGIRGLLADNADIMDELLEEAHTRRKLAAKKRAE